LNLVSLRFGICQHGQQYRSQNANDRDDHQMIYFDHNATAPVIREAREFFFTLNRLARRHAWPRLYSVRRQSRPARIKSGERAPASRCAEAREKLAAFLGCQPADIIWTSGATEANNTVMHHFARTLDAKSEVWISAIEHPCVHESAKHYFGKRAKFIPVTHDGVIDLDWLTAELADTRPGLVGIMAANNETGVIQPWREALAICHQYQVPFFSDAVQWLGKMPAKGTGRMRFLSGAAHKFGGPRGIGFLKVPHRSHVTPLLRRRQTGTGPPRRNGKCSNHPVHARRAGSSRKTDGPQRTHPARRLAREF
jgi:cysteine desulfurase